MEYSGIQEEVRALARRKNVVILAHNYQRGEVQEVADYVGESLGLCKKAAPSDADIIIFCAVDFMAATAHILAPARKVILPEIRASCPMAGMVDPDGLRGLKGRFPAASVVTYVNSSAEVKALSDICCTSANATKIVASIPEGKEIIFTSDRNLGAWVSELTGRKLILWERFFPTHYLIQLEDISTAREVHPSAKIVVHPECRLELTAHSFSAEGTSGMIRFCREDEASEYIIGTESGMIYRLAMDLSLIHISEPTRLR